MSERMTLALAFEEAGIERTKAERLASVIVGLIKTTVATKADVDALGAEMKAALRDIRDALGGGRAVITAEERAMLDVLASHTPHG